MIKWIKELFGHKDSEVVEESERAVFKDTLIVQFCNGNNKEFTEQGQHNKFYGYYMIDTFIAYKIEDGLLKVSCPESEYIYKMEDVRNIEFTSVEVKD